DALAGGIGAVHDALSRGRNGGLDALAALAGGLGAVPDALAGAAGAAHDALAGGNFADRAATWAGGAARAAAWAAAASFQLRLAAAVSRRVAGWSGAVSHWLAPSAFAVEASFVASRAGRPHLAIAHSSD